MTVLFFLASLLLCLTIGLLLLTAALPQLNRGAAAVAFRLFAGAGFGIGATSCIAFLWLLAGPARYLPAVDLAVCIAVGLIVLALFRRGRGKTPPALSQPEPFTRFHTALAAIFSLQAVATVVSFLVALMKEPHGRWDAWLIWNMHARFLYRSGEAWRGAFADGMDWSHWDYPLLLPLSTVRSWIYMAGESDLVPAAFALLFTFLVTGLLLASLTLLRGRSQGLLAAMVLMGTPFFVTLGASQFADIPFAFFLLATFVLLFLQGRSAEGRIGPLILAGAAAGLSAWTKNEGLLFMLVVTASWAGWSAAAAGWQEAARRTAALLAGALPVLLVVFYFKASLSPANDLVAGFSLAAASAKLLDPARYLAIAQAYFFTGISFTQGLIDVRVGMHFNPGAVNILILALYLLLAGIRIGQKDRPALFPATTALLLMLAGYFFVYVLTPQELNYHLMTSLNRLFLQLWPSALFLFFMAAGRPEGEPIPAKKGLRKRKPEKRGKEQQ